MIMMAPTITVDHAVGTPVTTLMTIEVANSRMPSASDRVTRNSPAESVVTRRPKRRCSSSYEVTRSPRK